MAIRYAVAKGVLAFQNITKLERTLEFNNKVENHGNKNYYQ